MIDQLGIQYIALLQLMFDQQDSWYKDLLGWMIDLLGRKYIVHQRWKSYQQRMVNIIPQQRMRIQQDRQNILHQRLKTDQKGSWCKDLQQWMSDRQDNLHTNHQKQRIVQLDN